MYAVIRNYAGNAALADQLAARADEVKNVVSSITGFRGYYLVRTEDGCATVSIYDDRSGAEESSNRAAEWLQEHAPEITASTPEVSGGEVLISAG